MSPVATKATQRTAAEQRALKVFLVLLRATESVNRRLQGRVDMHDLTLTEFQILEALYHKGPLLLGDLQKKISLSSGGVTYTVDRLAEKRLVERRECETDRRARYAALTTDGATLMDNIFPSHVEHISGTMASLTAKEQEELITLLKKLGLSAAADSR